MFNLTDSVTVTRQKMVTTDTVAVRGYPGTSRIVAERPGRDWATYLLSR